jgi:hypothetical protein
LTFSRLDFTFAFSICYAVAKNTLLSFDYRVFNAICFAADCAHARIDFSFHSRESIPGSDPQRHALFTARLGRAARFRNEFDGGRQSRKGRNLIYRCDDFRNAHHRLFNRQIPENKR